MKILSEMNCTQRITTQNFPVCVKKFETPGDSFVKTNVNTVTPCFKGSSNIYQKILNDPNLTKKFMGLLTLGIGTLLAAANADKTDGTVNQNADIQANDTDILSLFMQSLQPQKESSKNNDAAASNESELEELRKINAQQQEEIARLQKRLEEHLYPDLKFINDDTESPEQTFDDSISDDEIRILGQTPNQTKMGDDSKTEEGTLDKFEIEGESGKCEIEGGKCEIEGGKCEIEGGKCEIEGVTQFIFPKKHGRLSGVQQQLKDSLSNVYLSHDEAQKLTEICNILLKKEYITKSGNYIECDKLSGLIIERLAIDSSSLTKIINTCYKRLELENDNQTTEDTAPTSEELELTKNTTDFSDHENVEPETNITQDETLAETTDNVERHRHAPTSYTEIKEHPIEQPKVLGTVDLSRMERYLKPKTSIDSNSTDATQEQHETTGSTSGDNSINTEGSQDIRNKRKRITYSAQSDDDTPAAPKSSVTSSNEIPNPAKDLYTRLETTPDDPRISFPYFSSGKVVNGLFDAPDSFYTEGKFNRASTLKFKKDTAGEIAKILLDLERYYSNSAENKERRENLRIWVNNLAASENTGNITSNAQLSGINIRPNIDKVMAANITGSDIIQELKKNEYPNIEAVFYGNINTGARQISIKPNREIIDDIVDAINNDERFKNFSFHGAMRLIERLVDFSSNVSIQEQCSHILDRIYSLLNQALKMGVQVKTYIFTNGKRDKYDNIIVKINPNIVIPASLYTDEDKKLFNNDDILISLCEYQPGDEYDRSLKQPLIKTLMFENSW